MSNDFFGGSLGPDTWERPVEATYPTEAEAIAAAVADSEPGDFVTVHEAACAAGLGADCDCHAYTMVVGAGDA